jgi:hypothetical protein
MSDDELERAAIVKAAGYAFVGDDLDRATPESLAQEYREMLRSLFGTFRGNAERRMRAVGAELLRRGYTHIENAPFSPTAIEGEKSPMSFKGGPDAAH